MEPTPCHQNQRGLRNAVTWIKNIGAKKIALQFPEEQLPDAPDVTIFIRDTCQVEVIVLGDTLFGCCCVDDHIAVAVDADAVIHFGHTCLSEHKRLPILYVIDYSDFELEPLMKSFKELEIPITETVMIASDIKYHNTTRESVKILASIGSRIVYLEPPIPPEKLADGRQLPQADKQDDKQIEMPKGPTHPAPTLLYIGDDKAALTNLKLLYNDSPIYVYDPAESIMKKEPIDVSRQLKRRYYLIEKTKDAKLIGILVATLVVADYLDIIERIKQLITGVGKRYHTFVMGKLNISKMANFPEIDCFVVIACPYNSLLESKDFYRPVITPFELEVAFNGARTWTGRFVLDYRLLLPGGGEYCASPQPSSMQEKETDISLISGRIRDMATEDGESPVIAQHGKEITEYRTGGRNLSEISSYTGGPFGQRSWVGLEPRIGEKKITKAIRGQQGLAASYTNEKQPVDHQSKMVKNSEK